MIKAETEIFSYLPFGKQIPRGDDDQRTAYIGKELDTESELGDHGVRKVDYELGRFTTIDPLWEKYYAWSPYQYSMNNPVSLADFDGNVQGKDEMKKYIDYFTQGMLKADKAKFFPGGQFTGNKETQKEFFEYLKARGQKWLNITTEEGDDE